LCEKPIRVALLFNWPKNSMSQHFFSTSYQGRPITVLAGWDRPLCHHFMAIIRDDVADNASEKDQFLYHHLHDRKAWGQNWAYFKDKLDAYAIAIPQIMADQIYVDSAMNYGNRHGVYLSDGTYTINGVLSKAPEGENL
jgi:hypothetical protein